QPEDPPPPSPGGGGGEGGSKIDNLPMELVWRNKIKADSSHSRPNMQPLVYKDKVIFNAEDHQEGNPLRCYAAKEGVVQWEWNDWLGVAANDNYMNQSVHNQYWLVGQAAGISLINLNTGETFWDKKIEDKEFHTQIQDGKIYYSIQKNWGSEINQKVRLMRTSTTHFNPKKIIELRADSMGGRNHDIPSSVTWKAPWGDEMAVFKVAGIDWSNNQEFWNFYVYNMDADSIYYRATDIAPHRRGNNQYPVIDGHYAYLQTHRTLQCYDLVNRRQVWQHDFTGDGFHHFTFPNLLVQGERVYILGDDGSLFAFDKKDGSLLWSHDDPGGGMESYMHYYKGVLYYTGEKGKVYAVRARDGKVLMRMASYNNAGYIRGGLGISEKHNQLYVCDGWDVMAFQIPAKWHYE
ncbi:MAG: PQQ-binding-like beta-propeller repeat protein, partial [Schleiferiaceae bacterium]|nr:PQQ-binding-like beta-propeller repeat protein [Schleiferiaceae bacterium]